MKTRWALRGAAGLFGLAASAASLGGCGEDAGSANLGCTGFCVEIGCSAEEAECDSSNRCGCFGCQKYYDMFDQSGPNTGPAC